MNKRIIFLLSIIVSTIYIFIYLKTNIQNKIVFEDIQKNSLVQNIYFNRNTSFNKLLATDKISFNFRANDNYLGTISLLIDNYGKINKDILSFKVREKGNLEWYYQGNYETSVMDSGQYFPFGFPTISNSNNKIYEVEIESKNGTIDNSISLSKKTNYILAKYTYDKNILQNNIKLIPHFIIRKALSYLTLITVKDQLIMFVKLSCILTVLILFAFFNRYVFNLPKSPRIIFYKIIDLLKSYFQKNKIIFLIISIYFLTHIQFIYQAQYWDSGWYWSLFTNAITNFTKNTNVLLIPGQFIKYFNVLGHPSMGYFGLLSITQMFGNNNVFAVNLGNIIFAIMAIWSFYKIAKYFYPQQLVENILITFIFAFNPLFYATSISLNLDFPLLVFSTLIIESYLYKRDFSLLFWAVMLIFSKETGILIYLSIFGSYLFITIIKLLIKHVKNINYKQIIFLLTPVFIFGLYYIFVKGTLWYNTQGIFDPNKPFRLAWDNKGIFCFGLNFSYIKERLYQIYIMNFTWLNSLIIIMGSIKYAFSKKNLKYIISNNISIVTFISIFTLLFLTLINSLLIVMNFSRYVTACVIFITLLYYFSVNFIFSNKKLHILKIGLLFITSILMIIQTFHSIDPSAKIIFGEIKMGNQVGSPIFGPGGDASVYNTEFVFIEKISNLINKDTPVDYYPINDKHTGYFFKSIKFVGQIENYEKIYNEGYKKIRYVLVPWVSNRDEFNKIMENNKLYKITNKKNYYYQGYYFEVFDLVAIK